MAHEPRSPSLDYSFDFGLPRGIDHDQDIEQGGNQYQAPSHQQSHRDGQNNQTSMEIEAEPNVETGIQDETYVQLNKGFSEDEDENETFESLIKDPQAAGSLTGNKTSPRHAGEELSSPTPKKPRQSLFGGPSSDDGPSAEEREGSLNSLFDEEGDVVPEPVAPGLGIRDGVSNLSIEQSVHHESPSERPLNSAIASRTAMKPDFTPPSSRSASEESVSIPPDNKPLYDFRQNVPRRPLCTYIDTDMSGNFDPEEESRQRAARRKQARAAKTAKRKKEREKERVKKNKNETPKGLVMKCIVRLQFPTSFGSVRNITNEEDNWPEDWSDIESDLERELENIRQFVRHNTPGREMQIVIEDPSGRLSDLTGHPVARGCISCRKQDQDCSMIHRGPYPCKKCKDAGVGCELIIPPKEKLPCKQCDEEDTDFCSFEVDPTQTICDHCKQHDFICESPPPIGYRAERCDIDENIYGKDRPFTACTVCRQENKRCSLKTKKDRPPCKYCKKHRIGCVFFDVPKVESQNAEKKDKNDKKNEEKKDKGKGRADGDSPEVAMPNGDYFTVQDLEDLDMLDSDHYSRSPTPEIEMEDNLGRKGMLTKIRTCFAHPIEFNVTRDNISDCNFCEMPMFGFTGHFEREVHVIAWHNGLGYTELGGGHREDKGPTKMCGGCTIARIQMAVCEGHEFQLMVEDFPLPDTDHVVDELLSAEPGSAAMQYQLQRWCSMCFSQARYGCATPCTALDGDEGTELPGCGMRLCGTCRVALRLTYGGDFDVMVSAMTKLPKMSEENGLMDQMDAKPRADVGFLSKRFINISQGVPED